MYNQHKKETIKEETILKNDLVFMITTNRWFNVAARICMQQAITNTF